MPAPTAPPLMGEGTVNWTSRDGRSVGIRHIVPHDAVRLVDFYTRLSNRTRELRFATIMINVPLERVVVEAARLTALNPEDANALVALFDEEGEERIVAVARLAGATATSAEFALTVRDDFQGQGLGSYIFDLLVQVALVRGLKYLTAHVLAENSAMIKIIRRVGFPIDIRTSYGESDVTMYLEGHK